MIPGWITSGCGSLNCTHLQNARVLRHTVFCSLVSLLFFYFLFFWQSTVHGNVVEAIFTFTFFIISFLFHSASTRGSGAGSCSVLRKKSEPVTHVIGSSPKIIKGRPRANPLPTAVLDKVLF